jgi:hypothetical protein
MGAAAVAVEKEKIARRRGQWHQEPPKQQKS